MKYILALVVSVAFFNLQAQEPTSLSPDDFEKGLSQPQIQVLDVRTAVEYNGGHIKNAMQADWTDQDQFKDRVQYLDKSKTVMVYCASGGRSSSAAKWLRQNGFDTVDELKGGLTAWKAANKNVEGVAAVKQLTVKEYDSLLKGSDYVLVDFGAEWCPPCKKMEPVLSRLKENLRDHFKLVKVDGGTQTDIMKQLNVAALPVFIVYKNGKEVWRKQGVADIEELTKQLTN